MILLQKGDMEDVVNPRLGRELQVVGEAVDTLHYKIWPVVFERQYGQRAIADGDHCTLVQAEPNPIAGGKLQWPVRLIMSNLQQVLGLEETVADLCKENVALLQLAIEGRHPRRTYLERRQGRRCPIIYHP
jgi:hypothetical protein